MALFAMFEYLIYPLIGFVGTLGTRSRDGTLRDAGTTCMFKEVSLALTV